MTDEERDRWRQFFNDILDEGYYTPVKLLVDNRSGQRYSLWPISEEDADER